MGGRDSCMMAVMLVTLLHTVLVKNSGFILQETAHNKKNLQNPKMHKLPPMDTHHAHREQYVMTLFICLTSMHILNLIE